MELASFGIFDQLKQKSRGHQPNGDCHRSEIVWFTLKVERGKKGENRGEMRV